MSTYPKISVVIPCFNAKNYIAAAIESVLAQEWPNIEILVVDDGSSDGSPDLVQKRFSTVKLLRQSNQGVAKARNNGISQATGDWIAFLDADDIWLPGKLHAQMAMLADAPGTRMVYTAWQVWTCSDPAPTPGYIAELAVRSSDARLWSGASGWVYPQLLLDCVVWTSTVLAHRSVFAEVGQFDPTLRIGEDWDLWLRASRVTQILRVPAPYALYRMHPASITKSVPEANFRSVVVDRALARWGYASPDGSVARKSDVDRALARGWIDYAGAHLAARNFTQSISASFAAVRADWSHMRGWKVLINSLARSLLSGALRGPRN